MNAARKSPSTMMPTSSDWLWLRRISRVILKMIGVFCRGCIGSVAQGGLQRLDEAVDFGCRGVVHEGDTRDTARRIDIHGLQQAHGVEAPGADHEPAPGEALAQLPWRDGMGHERDGGCAHGGIRRAQQADIVPVLEELEQLREQRHLCGPQRLAYPPRPSGGRGTGVMMRVESIE